MLIVDGEKYACMRCIRGHRSSTCKHKGRPLVQVRKRGRPVSSCNHRLAILPDGTCECGVSAVILPKLIGGGEEGNILQNGEPKAKTDDVSTRNIVNGVVFRELKGGKRRIYDTNTLKQQDNHDHEHYHNQYQVSTARNQCCESSNNGREGSDESVDEVLIVQNEPKRSCCSNAHSIKSEPDLDQHRIDISDTFNQRSYTSQRQYEGDVWHKKEFDSNMTPISRDQLYSNNNNGSMLSSESRIPNGMNADGNSHSHNLSPSVMQIAEPYNLPLNQSQLESLLRFSACEAIFSGVSALDSSISSTNSDIVGAGKNVNNGQHQLLHNLSTASTVASTETATDAGALKYELSARSAQDLQISYQSQIPAVLEELYDSGDLAELAQIAQYGRFETESKLFEQPGRILTPPEEATDSEPLDNLFSVFLTSTCTLPGGCGCDDNCVCPGCTKHGHISTEDEESAEEKVSENTWSWD
ncbi:hypothetical protein V1511DRAFT_345973 [Dipodascopsis uninucleata]